MIDIKKKNLYIIHKESALPTVERVIQMKVTIYDVADLSGYSITTVSKVINDNPDVSKKAKTKVLDAINQLGYLPSSSARALATSKSQMIGVVFTENLEIGLAHPFFGPVIESFRKFVDLYNYDLLFVSRNIKEEEDYVNQLIRRGVDGIIVFSTDTEISNTSIYQNLNIPTVFVDMNFEDNSVVYSDNRQGVISAIDYLVSLGHHKIAHIHGERNIFTSEERIKGFNLALDKHQLEVPEEYIRNGGYYSFEGGRTAMMRLMNLAEPPTAVFASGDKMAIGAIQAIKEAGKSVPDDFSIIGFDDIEIAQFMEPALTTIAQDKEMIGRQAGKMLIECIQSDGKTYSTNVIPVKLVKRDSVAKIK